MPTGSDALSRARDRDGAVKQCLAVPARVFSAKSALSERDHRCAAPSATLDRRIYFTPPFGISDRRGRLTSFFRRFLRTGS